jgi:amidohydrolase
VTIKGTVRSLDLEVWEALPGLIDKALGSILAISGAGYTVDYHQGIPPVVNDARIVELASRAISEEIGHGTVVGTEQSMGGEDFSNYLAVTRGALLRLGAASGGGDLHSAGFQMNEAAIPVGIRAGVSALLGLTTAFD